MKLWGVETEVGKRLEAEVLAHAQRRPELAAELGRLQREVSTVQKSIIDMCADPDDAERGRGLMLPRQLAGKAPDLELIRAQARENWLAMRAEGSRRRGRPCVLCS